jgi:hypothetical protein
MSSLIEEVCRLTVDFYGGSKKSMMQLVAESGVQMNPAAIEHGRILAYVANHVDIIEPWLRWSANKRVSSGWYFAHQSGQYVVGYRAEGEVLTFAEAEPARAEFIMREVASLMAMRPRGK